MTAKDTPSEEIVSSNEELHSTNEEPETAHEELQASIKEAYDYAVHIVDTVRAPLVILNGDLRVRSANPAFYETFKTSPAQMENQNIFAVSNQQWDIPPLRALLEDLLPKENKMENYRVEHTFPALGRRVLQLNARKLVHREGEPNPHFLIAWEDITERERVLDELRQNQQFIEKLAKDVTEQRRLEQEVLEISAREQRRIGQELHDTVGQELTGLAMMADALTQQLGSLTDGVGKCAAKIRDGLERVLGQVRSLSRGLVPVQVDAEGLRAALEDLTARTNDQTGITCTFSCPHEVLVGDTATATHLFRIAQEAITNALRHSHAHTLGITLLRDDATLTLTVQDDGVGLPRRMANHEGLGMRIMQFRGNLIGATVAFGAVPGGGTLVTCSIPREAGQP